MDGSCVRCGQHIPAWLTFTLGRGGRVFCSEYCQRLDEQSRDVSDALRDVARHTPSLDDAPDRDDPVGAGDAQAGDRDTDGADTGADGDVASRRLRFLSRLR